MISNPGIQRSATYLVETADTYTIAAGVATIQQCFCILAAQSGTADDLDTVTLGSNFAGIGTYRPTITLQADTGDTITVKHNTGNIYLYGAADVTLTGNQILTLFYNGSKWMDSAKSTGTGMTSFTVAGDSGTPQTITDGNTLTIAGGTGLSSVAGATDTVTINLDNTAVTPASYTNADITVDAQGRITAAANGSAASSPWTTDTNVVNLVTDTDTVTIGSNTAGGKLFVDGDADEIQLQVQAHSSQTALLASFQDSGANTQVSITGDGGAVFNEEGNDADFRVETDTNANALFVDGGSNNVGMGTGTPNTSALVDMTSTAKGLLIPRMTTAQFAAISSKATGLLAWDTDKTEITEYDGAAVRSIAARLPQRATMWHDEAIVVAGNGLVSSLIGTQFYSISVAQTAAAINDEFTNACYLAAGTYNFYALGILNTSCGIITWKVDGTTIGTTDFYAAVLTVNTIRSITGLSIPTSGYHKITGLLASKNASSTDYAAPLTKYWFRQTSD